VYGSTSLPPNASSYTPKYISGARLPHAWITLNNPAIAHHLPPVNVSYVPEFTASDITARQYSTLDLCAVGSFTLLLHAADQDAWRERINALRHQYDASGPELNVYLLTADFDIVPSARGQSWVEDARLGDGGGLLVRPDQHILLPLVASTEAAEMLSAMKAHLGR
jgi:hypothetical protein